MTKVILQSYSFFMLLSNMLMFIINVSLLSRGMPDIQWMNLDPVKLMEELSQFTSLEGFKEMLDKAQVTHTNSRNERLIHMKNE